MAELIFEFTDALYIDETGEVVFNPTTKGRLVRCKDCKHRKKENNKIFCELDSLDPHERSRSAEIDEWFCGDGEGKEDETSDYDGRIF